MSNVNHPKHYNSDPSGVECIEVVRHRNFNVGNAIKYLWRAGLKHEEGMTDTEKQIEDLRKAKFYINDEITRLEQIMLADEDSSETDELNESTDDNQEEIVNETDRSKFC